MQVASAELKPSEHPKNIGVIFDPHVSLDRQIASVCKSAFYSIRAISHIRKFQSLDTAKTLVHALVISKVDHCNAIIYGLPKYKIVCLQYVLNSAARLVTLTHKHDHITPVLMELHWLPVEQHIEYKILLYTHKVVHGVAPKLKGTFRILQTREKPYVWLQGLFRLCPQSLELTSIGTEVVGKCRRV